MRANLRFGFVSYINICCCCLFGFFAHRGSALSVESVAGIVLRLAMAGLKAFIKVLASVSSENRMVSQHISLPCAFREERRTNAKQKIKSQTAAALHAQ